MSPETYVPRVFVGIGRDNCFFTLRETYLKALPGEGEMGNAVVNGVYQGRYVVSSYHIKNLSQDATEAIEKAQEYADKVGLALTSTVYDIQQELNKITRATSEQREERAKAEQRKQQEYEDWKIQFAAEQRAKVNEGKFAVGKWANHEFRTAPVSYINWMIESVAEFEEGSIVQYTAQKLIETCQDLVLPKPNQQHVGEIKTRYTFDVLVIKSISFISDGFEYSGPQRCYVITMIDKATGGCLVAMGSNFDAEVGETLQIKATVTDHSEYKGQSQTKVNRVKIID